jgi:Epoxide hydrolase N terminus
MRNLIEYWCTKFDWRAQEAKLNAFPQFKVQLAGVESRFC